MCQTKCSRLIDIRDLALLTVLRGGGVRRSEVANLELVDFTPNTGALEICEGKRKSCRTVYLPSTAIELVTEWLEIRGRSPGPLLCAVRKGGRIELRPMTTSKEWQNKWLGSVLSTLGAVAYNWLLHTNLIRFH